MKFALASLCVVVAASSAWAATPNLGGTWTGTYKGLDYIYVTSAAGVPKNTTQLKSGALTVTLAVSGTALAMNLTYTPSSKGSTPGTFTLNGYVGTNAFWATGIQPPVQSGDVAHTVYVTGHINKGTIKGLGISYSQYDDNEFVYNLKQSAAATDLRDAGDDADAALRFAPRGTSSTSSTGTCTGKQYTLATGKISSVKATFTGSFSSSPDGSTSLGTLEITGATPSPLTFTLTGPQLNNVSVTEGPDATQTYTMVSATHGNQKAFKGIAFILSATSFDELKFAGKISGGN
jgi:hypothetical protein